MAVAETGALSVPVKFPRSGIEALWQPGSGTLLEFAEESGLAPAFGCRSGICASCKTRILSGAVDYLEEPLAPRAHDEVLLCCSIPRQSLGAELVLDL